MVGLAIVRMQQWWQAWHTTYHTHYSLAYILKSIFWPNTKPNFKKWPFQYSDLYFALVDGTYPVNGNGVKSSIIEHEPITKHFSMFSSFFNQIDFCVIGHTN